MILRINAAQTRLRFQHSVETARSTQHAGGRETGPALLQDAESERGKDGDRQRERYADKRK